MSSKSIEAGRAFVKVDADQSALEKSLKQIEDKFKNLGASIGNIGKGVAAVGAGVAAIGASVMGAFAPAIAEAGDFAEVLSKFETVFGGQSDAVKSWANEYGKAVGRSESQLLRFLGDAQDTFVPLGFKPGEAEKFSKQLTTLAVDLASFSNQTDDEAFNRLLSAVVGNTENLRAFGVVAQNAQIKAKALAMGFDPKQLSAYQKAQVIMKLAIEGTTSAQGDALKTAGSYTNQVKALGASFTNLKVDVGTPLLEPIAKVLGVFRRIVDVASEFANANRQTVVTVAAIGAGLAVAGTVMAGIGVATIGLGATIASIGTIASAAFAAVGTAIAVLTSPITLAVAGIAAIGYIAFEATGGLSKLADMFGTLGTTATTAWGGIVAAVGNGDLQTAGQIAFTALEVGWLQITTTMQTVWSRVSDFFVNVWLNAVQSIVEAGASIYFGIVTCFDKLSAALMNGFDTAAVYITGAIDSIQTAIAKAIIKAQEFFGLFSAEQSQQIQVSLDQDLARRAQGREQGLGQRSGERAAGVSSRDTERQNTAKQFAETVTEDFKRRQRVTPVDSGGLSDAQQRLADLQSRLKEQSSTAVAKAAEAQAGSQKAIQAGEAQQSAAAAISAASSGSVGSFVSGVAGRIAGGGIQDDIASATKETADNTSSMVDQMRQMLAGGLA